MSVIEHRKGDLLAADAEALVNTVNTVGVMGKGVALQFRKAFPDNYEAYRRACKAGEVVPGRMFVFERGQLTGPRLIINFPTKRHWKGKARIEDIRTGLVDLIDVLRRFDVQSIAIPPLGCGNGGLRWSEVRPMIEAALAEVESVTALLYEPSGAPAVHSQRVATMRPSLTRVRADLIAAFDSYLRDPSATLTKLVAQKLAYLLQTAGEPLKLDFVKGKYGPYAENLNHALQDLEGHYIVGCGDRTGKADIRLKDAAAVEAKDHLAGVEGAGQRLNRVSQLIQGFESPFGLELLTTVHWAAVRDGATTPAGALAIVADWTPRKREVFQERDVAIAWDRLEREGWLSS